MNSLLIRLAFIILLLRNIIIKSSRIFNIEQTFDDEIDRKILKPFYLFSVLVLKTNYVTKKVTKLGFAVDFGIVQFI